MKIIACPSCGTRNRIDEYRAQHDQAVCGHCGTKLSLDGEGLPAEPLTVTDQSFERAVMGVVDKPVLVDCWAPWCGPCRMLSPIIDQIAAEAGGRYMVAKLNTDENPGIASEFSIEAIPTLLVFKNGELVDRLEGVRPKPQIIEVLQQHM